MIEINKRVAATKERKRRELAEKQRIEAEQRRAEAEALALKNQASASPNTQGGESTFDSASAAPRAPGATVTNLDSSRISFTKEANPGSLVTNTISPINHMFGKQKHQIGSLRNNEEQQNMTGMYNYSGDNSEDLITTIGGNESSFITNNNNKRMVNMQLEQKDDTIEQLKA